MAKSSTSWQKGHCPNPGGRIGGLKEIRDKALTLSLKGLVLLEKVIMDENEPTKIRLQALNMAMDRGLGKPIQAIEIQETPDLYSIPPDKMTKAQLEMLFAREADELFKSYLNTKSLDHLALLLEEGADRALSALNQSGQLKPLLQKFEETQIININ